MILAVIVLAITWKHLKSTSINRAIKMALVAVVITAFTAITAGSFPIVEISTGSNQELRVMPPTAFPFTMQQYRDYDTSQFYYRIVVGWPNGLPLYEGMAVDDQSEFILRTHLYIAVLLGEDISAGLMISLSVLSFIEKRREQERITQLGSPLVVLSVAVLFFIIPDLLSFVSPSLWFRIVFWGLFVFIGVYALSLTMSEKYSPQIASP